MCVCVCVCVFGAFRCSGLWGGSASGTGSRAATPAGPLGATTGAPSQATLLKVRIQEVKTNKRAFVQLLAIGTLNLILSGV